MKSKDFQIEDLLMNESFFNWVKNNNTGDSAYWEAWIKDHPEHHHSVREAIDLIESISFKERSFSSDEVVEMWNNIKAETIESIPIDLGSKNGTSSIWRNYLMKVAAVAIPILLGSVLYLYHDQTAEQPVSLSQELVIKEIPRGQKLIVYLPDGSRVKLNAESKISYPKPFDEDQRVISLEGEAFFEVTPNPEKPFLVNSGGIQTRVVGTSFNISAYSDDDVVEISVVTGEVSVKNMSGQQQTGEPIVLLPAEQATYSAKTGKTVVSGFSETKVLGWKDGTLYFNNATMDEFVAELERWYGIDIEVTRSLPVKKGIVGEFQNQSLEEILMGMHTASEFEYEFKDGKVIIK